MAFQKVYKGQTFPPNTQFPEHCFFDGCTFQASCKIKKGSILIGCTFQKCCPKPYNNPNSEVVDSIVENCTLEYVNLDKKCLSVNNKNTGNRVQDQGWKRDGVARGPQEDFCLCFCVPPDPCNGLSVAPKDGAPTEPAPVSPTCEEPCANNRGFGDSNAKFN